MKKLKLILCLALGCFLLIGGSGTAQAARQSPEMDKVKAIETLQVGFDYNATELGKYLDQGISYKELKNICMHALAANVPLQEVVDLRHKYGWTRVKFLLGLTPQKFYEGELQYKANRLYKIMSLDKKVAIKYMKLGFASHQVKRASYIARHCDVPLIDILNMKTRQLKWGDVAEQLGLPRDACMK